LIETGETGIQLFGVAADRPCFGVNQLDLVDDRRRGGVAVLVPHANVFFRSRLRCPTFGEFWIEATGLRLIVGKQRDISKVMAKT
jgi:hypothetical protein